MGKIFEQHITRFDGGIENDPRDPRENTCRVVSNFDILTNPRKMTPYRSSEDGDSAASTSQKQNFTVAFDGTTWRLFALGVKSGVTNAEVLQMPFTNFGGNTWTALDTNNQSTNTFTWFDLFVYYKKANATNGLIYGGRGTSVTQGSAIWAYDPSGSGGAAFAESALTITFSKLAQGLVHSKDDKLYIPYDNKIASKDGAAAFTPVALTLPSHLYITSLSEYGNYLAIACAPLSGVGNSRVFLWDRNELTTILSESIDWGSGILKIIEEIDGVLVGISITGGNTFTNYQQRVYFRYLNGNQAIKFKILENQDVQNVALQVPIAKQKVDNRLYFLMLIGLGGALRDGLWSIGLSNGQWVLAQEKTTNNNTALASSDTLSSFIVVEEYAFIAYKASGIFTISKTDDGVTAFAHNAIWESKIFDGSDSSLKKKLIGVTIHTEPLPANGQVIVKYKMDNETSFTTILTNTTTNAGSFVAGTRYTIITVGTTDFTTIGASANTVGVEFTATGVGSGTGVAAKNPISSSAINIESSGGGLPEFKEIQFRIESTGGAATKGAEVTGLSFKGEITSKRNY